MSAFDWYDELSDEVLFGPRRPLVPRGWKPGDPLPSYTGDAGEWREMTEAEFSDHQIREGKL